MQLGSDGLSYLASVALRTLVLAAIAWVAMAACRIKSPAARHAVWSVVVAGMLSLAAVTALVAPLPVRVLRAPMRARVPDAIALRAAVAPAGAVAPLPQSRSFPWEKALGAAYIAGLFAFAIRLAYGYLLTRRLTRAARPLAGFAAEGICESDCIHVPLTVGWLQPKILLPTGWDAWEAQRLQAVLVHERTHVRRWDWAIAVMAGVNRCVFWFHPLAWWLERQLSVLAEQACDDASLAQVMSRECYAETLVAMAAAVRSGEGRVAWEAMAMAKKTEVRLRVERILDEGRRIWPGMTRARWFALAAFALPLVYLTAVVRPARVRAQTVEAGRVAGEISQMTTEVEDAAAPSDAQQVALRRQMEEVTAAQDRLQEQKLQLEVQLQNDMAQTSRSRALLEQWAAAESAAQMRDVQTDRLKQAMVLRQLEIENMAEQLTENHPQLERARAALASLQDQLRQARESREKLAAPDLTDVGNELQAERERVNLRLQEVYREAEELRRRMEVQREAVAAAGPVLISRRDPEYTAEARTARKQGSVELSVTIDADGAVRDAKTIRSLDPGLDQKAIECIKLWRFTPAMRNGEPVTAFASVEVKFRLE